MARPRTGRGRRSSGPGCERPFEAHIGCQLLPTSRFVGLLEDAGFRDVGSIDVTPTHVVIHGTR